MGKLQLWEKTRVLFIIQSKYDIILILEVFMQIKLESLYRTYGDVHAVENVSLTIPSNTVFGIIGKSGAGKSSLVRLVSLLENPDSGKVFYDDKRVDNLSKNDLIEQRRRIGMIFQNFNLFFITNCRKKYCLSIRNLWNTKISYQRTGCRTFGTCWTC